MAWNFHPIAGCFIPAPIFFTAVTGQLNFRYLFQLSVAVHDSAAIENSRLLLDSVNEQSSLYTHDGLQLGPDKKIYVTEADRNELSVIQSPNTPGPGCNFQVGAINLGSGISQFALPNFIQNYFDPLFVIYDFSASASCNSLAVQFNVNNTSLYDSIRWSFDDPLSGPLNQSALPSPLHTYLSPGLKNVRLIVFRNTGCSTSDTIVRQIWAGPLNINLGADTSICSNDSMLLGTVIPGASYLWSNGSTQPQISAIQAGQYHVRVSIANCISRDTIQINFLNLPQFSLGNDTAICANQLLSLQANPAYPGASHTWSTGSAASQIQANPGLYWLQVQDINGCRFRDSIFILAKTLPQFNLGNDTTLCEGRSIQLSAGTTADAFLWSTGNTQSNIVVNSPGLYWLNITLNGCVYRDSIQINYALLPIVNLVKDTTLCRGNTLTLQILQPGASYLWSNGSIAPGIVVNTAGIYWVRVTLNNCSAADTIRVRYMAPPVFSLGASLGICAGERILLNPGVPGALYLWQNGSRDSILQVTSPGIYSVTVSNMCGIKADSISIVPGPCDLYIPSAFTPNGDNNNDLFRVLGRKNLAAFRLSVYNRWGQIVFTSADIRNGWDGRFKNIPLPEGLYIWTLYYQETGSSKPVQRKGIVALMR